MAFGANAVLIAGLGTPQIPIWQTAIAWVVGVILAFTAIYTPARDRLANQYFLAIAAIPFAASFISPDFAGLFFGACAGGIAAVAIFTIARIGPSDEESV